MDGRPAGWKPGSLPAERTGVEEATARGAVADINRALDDQITADTTPEQARMLIAAEVRAWIADQAGSGRYRLTAELEARLVGAVYNERFGLGALQPLLEDPDIETIDVNGAHQVWINYADGRKEPGEPVADSDAQLVELIRRWGAYQGQTARDFSPAKPKLRLALPDGSRLTALMAVTPRPCLSIRRHRMLDVDLDQLVDNGTLDPGLREFLRAAVTARKDIVVTGGMGSGKTTFARALAADFDRDERIVTIENEYELFLHTLPHRHADIVAMEAREPNAEGVGAIPVRQLVTDALRLNAKRIIVGEVLGDELVPMLTAMNTGGEGSLCTIHADSAGEVFARMLVLADSGGLTYPPATLFQLAGMAVDFVVHLTHQVHHRHGHPVNQRYVSEVLEVLPPGDTDEPATNQVYVPGRDGRAVPHTLPQCAAELQAAGFDLSHFHVEARAR
ncbi:ATPase, T2SS/T4P/T4SS family [Actinomadura sp. KC216]|uniref:CpaF family protein n=1 Tax=Actinomadura sp. KC216 TaxID=2530370 RepID=UPI0014050EB4|nr:ATPase, T2SS/T4P/T4SS family [Actinomadura sp. KC216]